MKTIREWNDMGQFGITVLTGEACTVGLRILCDLTAEGVKLMREVFGLPDHDWAMENQTQTLDRLDNIGDTAERIRTRVRQFDRNMNSGAIASIMLPRCLFTDLAIMACLSNGCEAVARREDGTVIGFEPGEHDLLARTQKYHPNARFYGKLKDQPAIGINAVAAWTGVCAGHNG